MTTFDPFAFTRSVSGALLRGDVDSAENAVANAIGNRDLEETHYRIVFARRLIREYRKQADRQSALMRKEPEGRLELVRASPGSRPPIPGLPARLTPDTGQGCYEVSRDADPLYDRLDLARLSDREDAALLAKAGFDKPAAVVEKDRIFVEEGCRLSVLGHDDSTVVTADGRFHPSRSGRIAKVSGSILARIPTRRIPEALILPFPHSPGNYFHALSEMVYGLRHAALVSRDTPIIYDEDRFSLLPLFAEALDITPARLVTLKAMKDCLVEKAYLPDSPPFYWSRSFFDFFRSVALRLFPEETERAPIYVSRQKSSRAAAYETRLQEELRDRGFRILHTQDMSVRDQIGAFRDASFVVAPHGAGLANVAFSPRQLKVVEIFNPEMISPDFHQRLKYLSQGYGPVVATGDDTVARVLRLVDTPPGSWQGGRGRSPGRS